MTTTTTDDLLIREACTYCADHPGMYVKQGDCQGRFDGVPCNVCDGSLVMFTAVPMPTTDRYNDPITSPSDLAFYESLTEVMREDMRSEFGTFATKVDGREVLIGGEDSVSECYCADCGGYSECGAIIYNLRWEGDDLPAWDEDGERVCISCGMADLYNDDGEALEAGRQAEAERRWEARREEGLI